ncbi:MAG: DUF1501 domain-containing protein [Pirellulales bacterium]
MPELPSAGQHAGFLGPAFEPLIIGNVAEVRTPLPDLTEQPDLPPLRMRDRQGLKRSLDTYVADLAESPEARKSGTEYDQALALLDAPQSCAAFDLEKESAKLSRSVRSQSIGTSLAAGSPLGRGRATVGHGVLEPEQPRTR